ncbi:MAG: ribonuclease P protein component [Pseudomonadota bacterium]
MPGQQSLNRLRRGQRLKDPSDFTRVFAEAARSGDDRLVVLATLNTVGYGRIGLAVGKKAVRRAVDRNRIKRVARETFRVHQHRFDGLDVVVLARRGLGELSPKDLAMRIERHLIRAKKRCANR